jgi:hypothetical protein
MVVRQSGLKLANKAPPPISQIQIFLTRLVALAVAWSLVLVFAAIVDWVADSQIWLFVVVWIWAGLFVMLLSPRQHPLPDGSFVDVRGALRMLWWAAQWPLRILNR